MLKQVTLNLLYSAIEKTKCYNLRLFYFSIYCFLLCGCGSKVQEVVPTTEVKRSELSTQLIKLRAKFFSSGESVDQEYFFNSASEVKIPEAIKVESGNAGNQVARIYFNVDKDEHFSFYCKYIGGASTPSPVVPDDIEDGKVYYFDNCFTEEGDQRSINYYPGQEPTIYAGNSVLFRIISADPRFDTEAISELEVDLH